MLERTVALNRFGLGARPGEAPRDPEAWLLAQLDRRVAPPAALRGLPSAAETMAELTAVREQGERAQQALRRALRGEHLPREQAARTLTAVHSTRPFRERLVAFWSNHFTVSVRRGEVVPVVGAYEREAIRPHTCGAFADLLLAAVGHPAMQLYLDNWRSTGPDSRLGQRRGAGLNENLAREVLELHTLGVDGGYGQADVEGLAALLTGWGMRPDTGEVAFDPRRHQPGTKTVLGRRYGEGEAEGERCLRDLAAHPSTRRHVCRKLARHFAADTPPPEAVAVLEDAWEGSRGDLQAVSKALVALPSIRGEAPLKWKSPWELVVSAARALDWRSDDAAPLVASMALLGQPLWAAASPAGWGDEQAAWVGPDALLRRIEWSHEVARRVGGHRSPSELGQDLLGDQLRPTTRRALADATSPVEGLTLLLASPEFQRR